MFVLFLQVDQQLQPHRSRSSAEPVLLRALDNPKYLRGQWLHRAWMKQCDPPNDQTTYWSWGPVMVMMMMMMMMMVITILIIAIINPFIIGYNRDIIHHQLSMMMMILALLEHIGTCDWLGDLKSPDVRRCGPRVPRTARLKTVKASPAASVSVAQKPRRLEFDLKNTKWRFPEILPSLLSL